MRTIRIGLCALALWAGLAAEGAAPVITKITMVGATPQFAVQSDLGITNQVQYCTHLGQTNWIVLTNLWVAQSPYWFVDVTAPPASQRFYRVAALTSSGMALIPVGSFTMGDCMGDGNSAELPLHTVYVSAFYMDRYLVTKSLWDTVYQWAIVHGYDFHGLGSGKASTHPVQTVDWYDCVKWCNARSEKEGRIPAYYTSAGQTTVYRSGQTNVQNEWVKWDRGYRLPTEAEWEKAARGGVSGQRFPWGNTISWGQANYNAYPASAGGYAYDVNPTVGCHPTFATGSTPYTSPVGYFAANGYGLYDMAGNVREWCWDWFGSYSSGSQSDPRGPASGSYRVPRSGCWIDGAIFCRMAYRESSAYPPDSTYDSIGFRSILPTGQ